MFESQEQYRVLLIQVIHVIHVIRAIMAPWNL